MSESAVVYSLPAFYNIMPRTCQSHQKENKKCVFFPFFSNADFVPIFTRLSHVFHLIALS